MAENSTFTMWRGSDVVIDFTSKSTDPTPPEALIVWTLADSIGGTIRLRKTATVISPTDLRVILAASDTAGLAAPFNYYWDAWDQEPGSTIPLAYGTLTMNREVSPYP